MQRSFKRRSSLNIPLLSRAFELTTAYLADGLYSAETLEAVLKDALGADKHILDLSHATATGTKVGLPVATVSKHPSYRVFTNYNGVGKRAGDQGQIASSDTARTSLSGLTHVKKRTSSSPKTVLEACRSGRCKPVPPPCPTLFRLETDSSASARAVTAAPGYVLPICSRLAASRCVSRCPRLTHTTASSHPSTSTTSARSRTPVSSRTTRCSGRYPRYQLSSHSVETLTSLSL